MKTDELKGDRLTFMCSSQTKLHLQKKIYEIYEKDYDIDAQLMHQNNSSPAEEEDYV